MGIGFVSDRMGRFTIPLDYKTDAIGLRIDRIRASNGAAGRATASLECKGPCTPFDAGDIALVDLQPKIQISSYV